MVRQTIQEARRVRLEERRKRRSGDADKESNLQSRDDKDKSNECQNLDDTRKADCLEKNEENISDEKSDEQRMQQLDVPVKVAPAPKTTILTPQRLSPPVTDLRDNVNPSNGDLDYADFDNDTSSPFDNMELKTINDMEELAQVLSSIFFDRYSGHFFHIRMSGLNIYFIAPES